MPGALSTSPENVVRRLMIDLGLGEDPTPTSPSDWSIYVGTEPNSPDNCITVIGTEGVNHGRTNPDGERQERYGIQVRVRGTTHEVAFAKANAIAISFDADVYRESVTIGANSYCVQSLQITSTPTAFGADKPASRRQVFTLNALAQLRQA